MPIDAAELSAPEYEERILFLGANGSGKSILAREMLDPYPRWTVIDPKWDFDPIQHDKHKFVTINKPDDPRWNSERVLYRPLPEYTTGPWMGFFLRRVFYQARKDRPDPKKRRILYLDEGLFGAKTGAAQWMANIAITGRSFKIGFWVASQRPSWIPVEIRTEAHRVYVFFLKRHDDRKEVIDLSDDILTEEQIRRGTESYQFWEIRREAGGRSHVAHYPAVKMSRGAQ